MAGTFQMVIEWCCGYGNDVAVVWKCARWVAIREEYFGVGEEDEG